MFIQNNKNWRVLKPRDFYRGYRYPLISDIIYNCTAFPVYKRSQKYTHSRFFSGFLAGVCISPMVFLFDTGKILRQIRQDVSLTKILKRQGKLATLYRESLAMTFYFSTYDYLKDKNYHPMLAGAGAGITNWTASYPIDVIRGRQIAQNISLFDAYKQKIYGKVIVYAQQEHYLLMQEYFIRMIQCINFLKNLVLIRCNYNKNLLIINKNY